ncbi:EexN family lipoprotein [Pseudomonas gingeri]|uniref:EexN family lipoprotein n=1 Tax=Pseudomonas gingeri TaxID=117681 RepID=UPI0015A0F9E4|nr:EexN family lipoprotein [Pseudomonas gingeri]NWE28039.1 EexN family lipoprotein [Pseudomonas gingeri]NWE94064.1 EexN family lipoprotein [Pseudomonas gingeri]
MCKFALLTLFVLLASCGKSESTETIESLMSNPTRLAQLREQCKINRDRMGQEFCNRVSEATNRRFFQRNQSAITGTVVSQ